MDGIISPITAAAGLVGILFTLLLIMASLYKKAGPNEALVISGAGRVRLRVGGGAVVVPMLQKYDRLSLEVITIDVSTPEVYTEQGVTVQVDGIAQVKVDSTDSGIRTAAEQFLGRGLRDIQAVARQTLEGHLRAILGTMAVEEIYKNREGFSQRVQEAAVPDLANMGLRIVSFTLRDIKDSHGYLDALGQPRLAQVKRDAIIAQAEADRDAQIRAAQAKQEGESARFISETQIAEANRNYEAKRAEYQATVNEKKAAADLAYDLQRFKTGQAVKEEEVKVELVEKEQRILLQEKEIQRRQRELEATVQKPADAKRYAIQTEADAEKYRLTAEAEGRAQAQQAQGLAEAAVIRATGEAEATASRQKGLASAEVIKARGLSEAEAMREKAASWENYNSAAVTQMVVEMLPKMAAAVSAPLAKTEKIIIVDAGGEGGGASRLTRDIASVMAQVPPVLEELSGVRLSDLISRVPGLGAAAEKTTKESAPAAKATVASKKA